MKLVLVAVAVAALASGRTAPTTLAECYRVDEIGTTLCPQFKFPRCQVSVGACHGYCVVNIGYCAPDAHCFVNVGTCYSGDNDLVRL